MAMATPTSGTPTPLMAAYYAVCAEHGAQRGGHSEGRVVVLFEVGSFYEVYESDAGDGCAALGDVCELLDIMLTRKDKRYPVSRANPAMAGFPAHALARYRGPLLDAGLTVVLATQKEKDGGGGGSGGGSGRTRGGGKQQLQQPQYERVVTQVLSRGTDVEGGPASASATAGLEGQRLGDRGTLACVFLRAGHGVGLAVIDLRTGASRAGEAHRRPTDDAQPDAASEEDRLVERVAEMAVGLRPAEVLVFGDACALPAALLLPASLEPSAPPPRADSTGGSSSSGSSAGSSPIGSPAGVPPSGRPPGRPLRGPPAPLRSARNGDARAAQQAQQALQRRRRQQRQQRLRALLSGRLGLPPAALVHDRLLWGQEQQQQQQQQHGQEPEEKAAEDMRRFRKPAYQNAVLRKAFPDTGLLSPAEHADLERRPLALTAFAALLDFAHLHGAQLVRDLPGPPAPLDGGVGGAGGGADTAHSHTLVMRPHTLIDLDVLPCPRAALLRQALDAPPYPPPRDAGGGGGGIDGPDARRRRPPRPRRQHARPECLAELLDRCVTAGGARLLRERLLRPSADPAELTRRYDAIDAMRRPRPRPGRPRPRPAHVVVDDAVEPTYRTVRRLLRDVVDVERAWRRVVARRGGASLPEAPALRASLIAVRALLDLSDADSCPRDVVEPAPLEAAIAALGVVDEGGGIARGAFADLDAARDADLAARAEVAAWADRVRACLSRARGGGEKAAAAKPDWVRPAPLGELGEGAAFSCTARRLPAVLRALEAGGEHGFAAVVGGTGGATPQQQQALFTHPRLREAAAAAARAATELAAVQAARAGELEDAWASAHGPAIAAAARLAAETDVNASAALDADQYALVRPELLPPAASSDDDDAAAAADGHRSDTYMGRAFLELLGLRHPMVERLRRDVPYVANDVALGPVPPEEERASAPATSPPQGLLLYGTNSAGKSSLSKAVAVAVLMAQAGLFVAARRARLCPFTQLMTRLAVHDDLARGESTFAVEMAELRDVLARAGPRALVVGDELCSGTESVSAAALVGAAMRRLIARGACFVFATHLHELARLSAVRGGPPDGPPDGRVAVRHLGVRFDEALHALVFERRLRPAEEPDPGTAPAPGTGAAHAAHAAHAAPLDRYYGLEVARAMGLDAEIMAHAHALRREILGQPDALVADRPSRYCRDVLLDRCEACGAPAEEAHHLVPQAAADARGHVERPADGARFRVHAAHNLAALCAACHDRMHSHAAASTSASVRRVDTTRGPRLVME